MDGTDLPAMLPPQAQGRQAIRAALDEARQRTWTLASGCSDEGLCQQVRPFLSPPVWDLGHMANFEELWLVQHLADRAESREGYNDTYNAFAHPREERPSLHLLDRDGVRTYMQEVRQQALQILDGIELDGDRLSRDGFVYWMIVLHEHQHQETLLQSFALHRDYQPTSVRPLPEPTRGGMQEADRWVHLEATDATMGIEHGPGAYDNEAPPHTVHVPAFDMAAYPVTNQAYLAFMQDDGYQTDRYWSERGRAWRDGTDHHAPLHWRRQDGSWVRHAPTGDARVEDVADEILCHVTWFEAEAYAAWAGARLPTEAEWERAARHDASGEPLGRNPWGDALASTRHANVDQLGWHPSRIGSHPDGATPDGIHHLIGDVWEWCSDGFEGYPGFEAYPYKEYSEVFFGGDHRILRGGSWATRAACATGTFRNWDHPYRKQIFSGIRLARDA